MKILITGGAGMVGSHCAVYYASKGHEVVVYDSLIRSAIFGSENESVEYNWNYLKGVKGVILIKKDVRDLSSLQNVFKEHSFDLVIHTAGQPGVRHSLENPIEDYGINCTGTVNVLDCVRRFAKDACVIYCSTNKVYGDNVNSFAIEETEKRYSFKDVKGISERCSIDLTGHTPYGVSKLGGDLYMQDFAHTYGIKTGIFRMSCIYGTRQFGFEDQGWLAWFSIRFMQKSPITIYGDGKQVRDVLWVEDLIEGYQSFIDSGKLTGVYNIGGGPENTLSLLELIDHLADITGYDVPVKFDDWRKFDQKVYISDIDKIREDLHWSPKVTPREGIERMLRWIKENKELF